MANFTNLDIDLVRCFATVADSGSFTRAAERLGRTQSTVSLQIQRLEQSVGHRLLARTSRRVGPTPEGEVLLRYARELLRLNDEAVGRLTEPELAGLVRLGTPEDFATTHLPDVLARFAESHPRVALEVHCDLTLRLLAAFEAGAFDLVLVKREPQGPMQGAGVWREPLVWAARPDYTPDRDRAVSLVLAPHPCVYRKRAIDALSNAARPWRVGYTSPSLAGAQAAVRAGLGVTVLPKEMVPQGLRILLPDDGFPALDDTEIALYRAPAARTRAAERLAEHIVASLERGRAR